MLTVSSLGERALIQRIAARLSSSSSVVVGPGDDAAVVKPARGTYDVFTTDALVDGVHFDRRFVPPDAVGYRALAVNLSDLAAMGAQPRAALLSLVLPDSTAVAEIDDMVGGMVAVAEMHGVAIVGGNVTRTPGPLMLDVTAIGSVRPRRALLRSGARPGDEVYVTGTLGDAAIGLEILRSDRSGRSDRSERSDRSGRSERSDGSERLERSKRSNENDPNEPNNQNDPNNPNDQNDPNVPNHPNHPNDLNARCVSRYLRPLPRVRAGLLLGSHRAATSCMDLSDGLADGVRQVAQASGVGITIDADALPISDEVRAWHASHGGSAVATALSGGDDYELLFTVRPAHRGRLRGVRRRLGSLTVTRIGTVTRALDLLVREDGITRPMPAGFEHFR